MFSFKKAIVLLFLTFLQTVHASSAEAELIAQKYLDSALRLSEVGKYDEAIRSLNMGLGLLKESSTDHSLRKKIESEIKIAKGKFLLSRYDKIRRKKEPENTTLPLRDEDRNFLVSQVFGRVSSRQVWEDRSEIQIGDPVGFGRRLTTFPNSGIEIRSFPQDFLFLRTVDASTIQFKGYNEILINSGSILIGAYARNFSMGIKSPNTKLSISSTEPFAIMLGVTTNGGIKIISLLGRVTIDCREDNLIFSPGDLCFGLPDGLSRKMSIELSTLMVTSKLITGFEKPLPFMKRINQQAMMQALRTKQRFRTVVGDVKGTRDFEIKVIEEK